MIGKRIMLLILFLVALPLISYGHSGRTDGSGGHYDYSTGKYHYHHGYSEHRHINGLCPYEANLSELLPVKCPKCKATINAENGVYCFDCAYRLLPADVKVHYLTNGDEKKTRAQYYNEVLTLKREKEQEQQLVEYKQNTIKDLNNQIQNKKEEIKTLNGNQVIIRTFYITTIIAIIIYFKFCKKKDEN